MVSADLRSFGTIGFQDFWLARHNIKPENLPKVLADSCFKNNVSITAITSEDDKMVQGMPEDRFGYFRSLLRNLPGNYAFNELDENLVRIRRDREIVYFLNSETIHAPHGTDWNGLKAHIIGANMLKKDYQKIEDVAMYAQDKGLLSFLTGIHNSSACKNMATGVIDNFDGVITYDSNNCINPKVVRVASRFVPKINKLWRYTRSSNDAAKLISNIGNKPGIAVSSSHWPHQMGRAMIALYSKGIILEDIEGIEDMVQILSYSFKSREYDSFKRDENHPLRVMYLASELAIYAKPSTYRGSLSSYN